MRMYFAKMQIKFNQLYKTDYAEFTGIIYIKIEPDFDRNRCKVQ